MRQFVITIRGPQRFMRYSGLFASSVDALLATLDVAELGERISVVAAEVA